MGEVETATPAFNGKTIEEVRAQVKAFEANPVPPGAPVAPAVPPTATSKPQENPTPPAAEPPPPESKEKETQQPEAKTEKVASEKPKAAESVKDVDWKARYLGLQRKFDKTFSEKKPETVQEPPKPISEEETFDLTPELKKKLDADSEKDPWETIARLTRSLIRQETKSIKTELASDKSRRLEMARLEGLDRLVSEGHDWLTTDDGLRKVDEVFAENPELWNTKDPYRAALGFIRDVPSKARQTGTAQPGGLTPILGAATATPPVQAPPAVSNEVQMENLRREWEKAVQLGDREARAKIMAQMDRLNRG